MKALKTITGKLLLLTIGSFVITLSFIFIISDIQLHKIINTSQNNLYKEKIDIIYDNLLRTDNRLQKTGLVDAYSDDFKSTELFLLKEAYYKKVNLLVFPFITDSEFNIILYPESSPEDIIIRLESLSNEIDTTEEKTKSFQDQNTWYIYREFEPWDWIIFYSVPLDEKYKDVYSFRRFLIFIIIIFTIFLSLFLSILMINFTKPIRELTRVSQMIKDGDLTQVINTNRQDEIGILSRSFFQMQNSIKQKIEDLNKEINEREKAEKNLNETRYYINNIVDSMPSAIIGVDRKGFVTQWNSKAEQITSIKSEKAKGKKIKNLMPYLFDESDKINKAILTNKVQVDLQKIRILNKEIIYEDITVFPLTTKGHLGAVIRIDDVTEKKLMEEQLAQSQKMDAIGQLAGGIAHDFNNMLTGISGAAQLLQTTEAEKDSQAKQYIEMILEASERAGELIQKLLAFGRKSHLSTSTIDLHKVIKESISLLTRTIDKKIQIEVNLDAVSPHIIGNFSAIQNALMNMAINSSHAMENGGVINISTRNIQLDQNYCSLSPFSLKPGDFIDLEIRDNGTGISPEFLNRIFEPFFTTKNQGQGTGLGLASVYGTIQNHKGAITVNSEISSGTVFHLFFPCTVQKPMIETSKKKGWKGKGTILFIDDEELIRLTAKPILESLGFKVLLSENGEEGLIKYKENKEIITLVITDMIMPKMNGREVFQNIHKLNKKCPILVSSGFTRDENLDALKKQGLAGFLQKPFNKSELEKILSSLLD